MFWALEEVLLVASVSPVADGLMGDGWGARPGPLLGSGPSRVHLPPVHHHLGRPRVLI